MGLCVVLYWFGPNGDPRVVGPFRSDEDAADWVGDRFDHWPSAAKRRDDWHWLIEPIIAPDAWKADE